ncbi:uncharacterized protein LOC143153407 [Ptiloglossa arizonensis]|uniref:uncharacterized protein LOC143153407 n=1 Tax=Ptiloglossa arizonensis TaxID=3350558 RepID=UPI003FA1355A
MITIAFSVYNKICKLQSSVGDRRRNINIFAFNVVYLILDERLTGDIFFYKKLRAYITYPTVIRIINKWIRKMRNQFANFAKNRSRRRHLSIITIVTKHIIVTIVVIPTEVEQDLQRPLTTTRKTHRAHLPIKISKTRTRFYH